MPTISPLHHDNYNLNFPVAGLLTFATNWANTKFPFNITVKQNELLGACCVTGTLTY